jgi:hypothetical protein
MKTINSATRWVCAPKRKRGFSLAVMQAVLLLGLHATALTIVPAFDVTITRDPQAATIEATINSAIALYGATFSDAVTVNFTFYETNIGLAMNAPLAVTVSYSSYRAALEAQLASVDDATALAHLPNTTDNPVNGNANVSVMLPLARALGLTSYAGSPDDSIAFNPVFCNLSAAQTDPSKYSLFATICHEIDEGLGFGSILNTVTNGAPPPTGPVYPEDLFRYDQTGARSLTTNPDVLAYFSLDSISDLARFNQDPLGDYNDWYSPYGHTPPQVQDAFGTPGETEGPGVELRVLDAIGYTRVPATIWVDFNYGGFQKNGNFNTPFKSLAGGTNAVASGGTIAIKSGSSPETMTISKPMTLVSFGGAATVGH